MAINFYLKQQISTIQHISNAYWQKKLSYLRLHGKKKCFWTVKFHFQHVFVARRAVILRLVQGYQVANNDIWSINSRRSVPCQWSWYLNEAHWNSYQNMTILTSGKVNLGVDFTQTSLRAKKKIMDRLSGIDLYYQHFVKIQPQSDRYTQSKVSFIRTDQKPRHAPFTFTF